MKKNKVYITAYSSISSLGIGNAEVLKSLSGEEVRFTYPKNGDIYKYPHFAINNELPFKFDTTRSSQIALNLLLLIEDKIKTISGASLYLATSTGGIKETEEIYKDVRSEKIVYPLFQRHFFNKTASDIKDAYKNKFSEVLTFSTACSSSGHSVLQAHNFIQNGLIEKAVIIGVDTLSLTTMVGFDSLKLVSHTGTKPLTNDRDGLSLGEGGGIIVLESNPENDPIGEVLGCSSNSDGYHISSPNPEGDSQKSCILDSISKSGLGIEDIGYISAHGTGTPMNDEIEMRAVKSIFPEGVTVTSLKSFIGHTLGASAVTEMAIVLEMLSKNKIYQPKNFSNPIDEKYIPVRTIDKKVNYFLKNSFGFGGNNVSIVTKINN